MKRSKNGPPVAKKKTALFHTVANGTTIIYQGQELKKFAPKKAMSPSGKVHLISDASTVEIVENEKKD